MVVAIACAVWIVPAKGPNDDPPYQTAGRAYRFHDLDYPALAEWCKSRTGQVIVCENAGAAWLPFEPFRTIKGLEGKRGGKQSVEVIWNGGVA